VRERERQREREKERGKRPRNRLGQIDLITNHWLFDPFLMEQSAKVMMLTVIIIY
jgi:hypothetical protein